MSPIPDRGESSFRGSGKLDGKKALITGADPGIGRAVASVFAREGVDVVIANRAHDEGTEETARLVRAAGRKAETFSCELGSEEKCRKLADYVLTIFDGSIDVLVSNTPLQESFERLEEMEGEEWERTFAVKIQAMFHLVRALVPAMGKSGAMISAASINADKPNPDYLPKRPPRAPFTTSPRGPDCCGARRWVNCVAPGFSLDAPHPFLAQARKGSGILRADTLQTPGPTDVLAGAYV